MDADQKDREIAERQNPGERLSSEEKAPRVFTANNLPSGVGFPGDSGLSVGETIGDKYRVVKLLGVGASGSVYEAEHKEIGRHVAIKVVHRALATRRDIVARFRIEARICAKIRNPHVGQVYDVGQLPDGSPYMVMELHEGTTPVARLSEGPLPIPIAIEIVRQVLSALHSAQELGVVHRDVKPGNLIIATDVTGEMIVKLVDFGISKPIAEDVASRSGRISLRNVTLEGAIVGSPDYMPPEQLRGREIDHRTDLYSTGVVLYEMVTGRLPFNAPSLTELMAAILRDPVAPPSRIRADCPPELESVILQAISRSKADRFQTALEMSRALESVASIYGYPTGAAVWALDRKSFKPQAAVRLSDETSVKDGYVIEAGRGVISRRWYWMGFGAVVAVGAGLVIALTNVAHDPRPVTIRSVPRSGSVQQNRMPAIDLTLPDDTPAAPSNSSSNVPGAEEAPTASAAAPGPVARDEAQKGVRARVSSAERRRRNPTGSRFQSVPDRGLPSSVSVASPATRASAQGATTTTTSSAPRSSPSRAVDNVSKQPISEIISQASAAYVRGQVPVARALYAKAVELAPRNPAGWRGLGMASTRMGQKQDAARAFERYLRLAPSAPDAVEIRQKLEQLR